MIAKAKAFVSVQGYDTTYSGKSFEAAGVAYGVGGVQLPGLDLSGTVHSARGIYRDTWTFSNPNYNPVSGTVLDIINPVKLTEAARISCMHIVLQFTGPLDQKSTKSVKSYHLVTIPSNPRKRPVRVAIVKAVFDPTTYTVTLTTRSRLPAYPLQLSGILLDFSYSIVSFSSVTVYPPPPPQ